MNALAETTDLDKLPHRVFKRVEAILYNYPVNKLVANDYQEHRQDVLQRGRQMPENTGRMEEGNVEDPTGDDGLKLHALSKRHERVAREVAAIESLYAILPPEEQRLVKLKYWGDNRTNQQVAQELSMSETRFYKVRERVVRKFAVRMGLV